MISSPTLQSGTADRSVETMARLVAKLHGPYFDDLLDDDVDTFLGADAGPTGLAGSRPRPRQRRSLRQLLRIARPRDDAAPGHEPRGAAPSDRPTMHRRAVHMQRALGTLADMAYRQATPGPELDAAIEEADLLRAREVSEDTIDLAHLRRLAMAMLELLDHLTVEDDQPLPGFKPQGPAFSGWLA